MTRRMHTVINTLCLTLATMLAMAMATTAGAADASPPAATGTAASTPIDQVQELSEILVRGKKLRDAIADAEDEFFALYNKVNKDQDFSTSCIYINMDPDTLIKSRICIPGFMADALADQMYFAQQCQSPGNDENGDPFPPPACYTPPSPQLVLMQRSAEYANHMLKVIRSDDRLGKMAGNLDNLYYELTGVQQQYLKVKASEVKASKEAAPSPGAKSPRN